MKPVYLIWKDGLYFQTRIEHLTGSGVYHCIFTVYRYDAARIPDLEIAKRIVRKMAMAGEIWKIIRFFPHKSGQTEAVWTYRGGISA